MACIYQTSCRLLLMLVFSFNVHSSSKGYSVVFSCKTICCQQIWSLLYLLPFKKIGGDSCQEIPLSQLPLSAPPTSSTNTMKTLNCPGTPEYQNQTGDSVRRLASKVSFHLLIDFQYVRKPLTLGKTVCFAKPPRYASSQWWENWQ